MDALRTLYILDQVLGVGTVIVVHHTGWFNPIPLAFLSSAEGGERETWY